MSKQYKLIKWYPSLPKDFKEGNCMILFPGDNYYVSCNESVPFRLIIPEIENNPEFWEKVVEKEYEILQLICKDNDSFYNKILEPKENGLWQWENSNKGTSTLESLLECKNNYLIHSVKRLSDGEVFTVGDHIHEAGFGYSSKISSFKLSGESIIVYYGCSWCFLNNTVKNKQPLFTTDDGVDIYEGDSYYFISPQKDRHIRKVSNARNSTGSYGLGYFKSKQKAREWVDQNKPLYSKKDIENAIDYSNFNGVFERFANINLKSFWEKLNDN